MKTQNKSVSVVYLQGLLANTTKSLAKKLLKNWITRDNRMVHLSDKESIILDLIKRGGPISKNFSTKN